MPAQAAFLLDVDNTLLDNDRVKQHLEMIMRSNAGAEVERRFWELYEQVRADLGAVSVPVTLERLRQESADPDSVDRLGHSLYATPFADFVYPSVPDLLRWLRGAGLPVILSDGDPWFQSKKITDAGLGEGVSGNVLIFLHKEDHVDDIRRWYPAERYFAIDDKAPLLALMRRGFGDALTTVWVRQGHYAEALGAGDRLPADHSVESIADVRSVLERLL
jgi:hypothetical protein